MYKKMYNRIRIPVKSGSLWYFISKWKKSHCKHHYIHKYSIIALEVSESVLFIIATILSVSSNRKSPTFVSLTLRNSLFNFGIGCLRATVQKQTRKETKSFDLETHGLICIFFVVLLLKCWSMDVFTPKVKCDHVNLPSERNLIFTAIKNIRKPRMIHWRWKILFLYQLFYRT